MSKIVLTTTILSAFWVSAQNTGVNTTSPKATLDVVAKNTDGSTAEGMMIPRLTGDQVQAMTANLTAEQNSMVVYVISPVTTIDTSTDNVIFSGYYRFNFVDNGDGTFTKAWVRMEPSGLENVANDPLNPGFRGYRFIGEDSKNHITGLGNIDMSITFPNTNIGYKIGAAGEGSISMGLYALAKQYNSIAIGTQTIASSHSTAIGMNQNNPSTANGEFSLAMNGGITDINAPSSVALGGQTFGAYSFAGPGSNASGNNSVAFSGGEASGDGSIAFSGGKATGSGSTAFIGGEAKGQNSLAYGRDALSSGIKSLAMGERTTSAGVGSVAIGNNTMALAASSLALVGGEVSSALADASIAIGYSSKAIGPFSTAIGAYRLSLASGYQSLSLGGTASGDGSTSINGTSQGYISFAVNEGIALNSGEFAYGKNFLTDTDTDAEPNTISDLTKQLFSIGNGSLGDIPPRSNAIVVLRNAKTGIGLPTDTLTPANSKPTEMLDVNGNIRVRGTEAAITVGGACANVGTISFYNDNFYGCKSTGWVLLNN